MTERVFMFCLGCIYGDVTNIILIIKFFHMNDGLENKLLILFAAFLLVIGCKQDSDKPVRIDFDAPAGLIGLELSTLLSNYEMVQLETNQESLIGVNARVCITDKHIVVINPDKILKFDRNGRFLKTIMTKGNGPGEFGTVVNPVIVAGKEILYYIDFNAIGTVQVLDLITDSLLNPAKPIQGYFSIHAGDKHGYIYGISNTGMRLNSANDIDSISLAFKYNPVTDSLFIFKGKHLFAPSMFGNVLYGNGEYLSLVNFNYSDTLFLIDNHTLVAKFIIGLKRVIGPQSNSGSEVRLIFENSNGYIFQKFDSEIAKRDNGSLERRMISSDYLYLDKQTKELFVIESINFENLNQRVCINKENDLNIYPIPVTTGEYAYFIIDAISLVSG